MKNEFSFLKLATLATCTLMAIGSRLEAQIYEYDWIGGEPGFSGKLYLDAPSSASAPNGGTVADVLPGSYLTTPRGYYPVLYPAGTQGLTPWVPNLIWDQTKITAMFVVFQPTTPIIDPYYNLPSVAAADVRWLDSQKGGNGIEVGAMPFSYVFETADADDDYTGQWLAVPEPSVLTLAGFGMVLLFSCRAKKVCKI